LAKIAKELEWIGNGDQSRRIRNGQFSEDTFGLPAILF
jgi:hypothetical protein